MNLLEILKLWDTNLFLFINGAHASFFDSFMFLVSNKLVWIPLYASVLYVLIRHWKKEAIWLVLALILCIVISDQISSGILKDLVKRLRPSHAEDLKGLVHLVKGYAGGKYGFASSHASNAAGFALLSALLLKRRIYTYSIVAWAFITGYSRIYLGVHYPLDILGGFLIGALAALACYWLICRYRPSLVEVHGAIERSTMRMPIVIISLSFLVLIFYSLFQ